MQADIAAAVAAYQQTGNKAAAAKLLGVPVSTLKDRLTASGHQTGLKIKGTSTLYDAEGNERLTWVKTATEAPSAEEVATQCRYALDSYKPPKALKTPLKATETELATVYPFADLHVGLRSWAKETGHNYDLQIAQDTLEPTITRLIGCAPQADQAVILGLGDLLHADNYESMTTKGTPQDVDGRYPKTLYAATHFILYSTDLALQKHRNVLIVILPGNHDETAAVAIRLALALHYRDHDRVTVCEDAGRFWWWEWGQVLLGATHGDKAKMRELALVMAARNPEAWGRTKFRHCLTGHIHHESVREDHGVRVESFASPAAPDSFHAAYGYDSARSMQAITYHKTNGEIMRHKVNIV
jgi:hypothetical protein